MIADTTTTLDLIGSGIGSAIGVWGVFGPFKELCYLLRMSLGMLTAVCVFDLSVTTASLLDVGKQFNREHTEVTHALLAVSVSFLFASLLYLHSWRGITPYANSLCKTCRHQPVS